MNLLSRFALLTIFPNVRIWLLSWTGVNGAPFSRACSQTRQETWLVGICCCGGACRRGSVPSVIEPFDARSQTGIGRKRKHERL